MRSSAPRRGRRRVALVTLAVAVVAAGCASEDPGASPEPAPSTSAAASTDLTLAVYGSQEVTDTYEQLATQWATTQDDTEVRIESYDDRADAMAALTRARAAGDPPDLFLTDVEDLPTLVATDAVRRVDDLLSARQVDFGDGFNRRGLEAFGQDSALQCMPVDVSPLVVYYNPQLIELDQINADGGAEVTPERGWRLDEMARAAQQPRAPGVRGLYVAPTLDQVAPFLESGGGTLVDETDTPSTLTFTDDASASAMEELLAVVRDPGLTFGPQALERKPALQRFIDGQLGMMLGYRDLVGTLRQHPDLTFDVMPMPVLGSGATSGRMTGLCISADSPAQEQAADLLVDLVSTEAQDDLAATGSVMPTNLESVDSEDFLMPGQRPLHTSVFVRELRDIQRTPVSENWRPVAAVASRQLAQLFYEPLIGSLDERLAAIDAASEPLLATDDTDDTGEDSGTPSPSSTDDG